MTEKERFMIDDAGTLIDKDTRNTYDYVSEVCPILNKQEERIKELETRNKRQYDLLKKLSDLMYKRDWKSLEKIVEDWEESDRLLQAEFKCCDGDVE